MKINILCLFFVLIFVDVMALDMHPEVTTGPFYGYYLIINRRSGRALTAYESGDSTTDSLYQYTPTADYSQQWIARGAGDNYYFINRRSNGVITASEDGNTVEVKAFTGAKNQMWGGHEQDIEAGVDGWWVLVRNNETGRYLDLENDSGENNVGIIQSRRRRNNQRQQWGFIPTEP